MDCANPTTAVVVAMTIRNAHLRTMNSLGMCICCPISLSSQLLLLLWADDLSFSWKGWHALSR